MKRSSPHNITKGQEKKLRLLPTFTGVAEAADIFNRKHLSATPKLSNLERYGEHGALKADRFTKVFTNLTLSDFLLPYLQEEKYQRSRPKVLIVTSSALRACDIHRSIASLHRPSLKLFAKHMKLKDQIEVLKVKSLAIAIGTPHRLLKLSENEALDFKETRLVVIDMHRDKKNYDILSMPAVAQDFFKLFREFLLETNSKFVMW